MRGPCSRCNASGIKIAPSILSADFARLAEEVRAVQDGGGDAIHVDVMDGRFVPDITVGPLVVKAIRPLVSLPLEVHLMIVEPERFLDAFAEAGANLLYVHQEACPHLHRTLGKIRELGLRSAVALNPSTPISTIEDLLPDIDRVLIMTVNPGFGGQSFISTMLPKVERMRKIIDASSLPIELEVDGGINPEHAAAAASAGATHLVAGSFVFKSESVKAGVDALRKAARSSA